MQQIEVLIEKFYSSFAKHDYRSMQQCYHENASFADPVFPDLEGKRVKAMWHMLCEAGKDLKIEYNGIGAYGNSAKAKWNAVYTFSKTGRIVHNSVASVFIIQDGLIISQHDSFDLWKWSRMALGSPGVLLGWSSLLKSKIKDNAHSQLKRFIEKYPEYQ